MPRQTCQVCALPPSQLEEINSALASGSQQKPLAEKYHVTRASLSRHKTRHINPTSADMLALEAAKWAARADEIWRTATASEDTRGQALACAQGLRALGMARQQEKAELKTAPAPEFNFRVADIDAAVNKLFADADKRTNLLALEKSELLLPDCYQLFEKMLNNLALKQAVLRFAQNYEINLGVSDVSNQATAAN